MRRQRSLILDMAVVPVFHTALLFSVFLLFAGHNEPGGGFVGGLVAGAAFVLRYVEGGPERVQATVPLAPELVLGSGLTVAIVAGVTPWLFGGQLLEAAKLSLDLPALGTVKASSALPFDVGVYLVVVGLVLGVLSTLGGEEG